MEKLTIKSNYKKYKLLSFDELTEKEKADMVPYDRYQDFMFVRYRGIVYNVSEMMATNKNSPFPKFWQVYEADSFFSGVLLHLDDDNDYVVMGRYYC